MDFAPFDFHEYVIKRLHELRPLEKYIYFTGFLEEERLKDQRINAIANAAYRLMERKIIILTQKRLSLPISGTGIVSWIQGTGNGFSYIAIGTIPKRKKVDWM
jgi:hypothetical protein